MGNIFRRVRQRSFASAVAITAVLAAGALAGAAPANAAVDPRTGSISGTITQNIGGVVSPAVDVEVYAQSTVDNDYAFVQTDAAGHYSVDSLAAGDYTVQFDAYQNNGLVSEYYDDAADAASAKAVVVGSGAAVPGIDAVLEQGATITGTLTQTVGGKLSPAADVQVAAYSMDYRYSSSVTADVNGKYSLSGLRAGTYKLEFNGTVTGVNVVTEWYKDAADYDSAASVVVGARATVPGIDATLAEGTVISGTVTQKVGSTISAASTSVYVYSGVDQNYIAGAYTDADGRYSVVGLPQGSTVVQFSPYGSALAAEYWDNSPSYAGAKRINLGAAVTVPGIDAQLEVGGTITGQVTKSSGGTTVPAPNVSVYADSDEGIYSNSVYAQTDEAGNYTLQGLNSGSYRLEFDAGDDTLVSKWYQNSASYDSATAIVLGAQATISGINAHLGQASTISGQVTKKVDGIVSNASEVAVVVFTADGDYVRKADTTSDGKYSVGSLKDGTYKVGFFDASYAGSLADEFYDNVPNIESAKLLTVGTAATLSGVNAELSKASIDPIDPTPTPVPVDRLAGPDRFSTSAAISASAFRPGVSVAYIANGTKFPDALSAAPVAAKDNAPVLLVQSGDIPAPIKSELTRLKPARIVVLGSADSISNTVQTALQQYTTGVVSRTAGADRFATSAKISETSFTPGVSVAYIANGFNFPDALSAAPAAGMNQAPVLLVPNDRVPDTIQAELTRLKPGRIVVLGSAASITEAVKAGLQKFTTGEVTRLAGADRFDTSAAISKASFESGVPVVYISNGFNFPDALSGAPVAGMNASPVLLVQPGAIPAAIQAELTRLKPARIVILGDANAVSGAVAQQLAGYVTQ